MLERTHFEHGRFKIRAVGVVALLGTIVAFVLSMLCIFAGSKPNMMEKYDLFTLNLTRLGDNFLYDIDNTASHILVRSLLDQHIGKRDLDHNLAGRNPSPIVESAAIVTPAPTPAATLRPRDIFSSASARAGSDLGGIESAGSSDIGGIESDGSSITSRAGSDISSATSRIASDASSALGSVSTELANALAQEFTEMKEKLDIHDWYSVHLLDYCEGYYVPNKSDISNTTIDGLPAPAYPHEKITKNATSCTKHTLASDFDPKVALLALYCIGVAFTGLSLLLSAVSAFRFGWVGPFINIFLSLLAFFFLGISSIIAQGLAVGAAKLITALGDDFGVAAYKGSDFFKLTWTATALMLLNVVIWTWEFGHRFRMEFRQHLDPMLGGFKRGLNPSRRSKVYEKGAAAPYA
ncbi:MAG: hypothetical protein Q9165_008404 [Trypethelium subeluteriae]